MKTGICILLLVAFLVSACGPGQLFGGPTLTPTPTVTSTPTSTATLTLTPTITLTPTPAPTLTPTALPGLGVKTSQMLGNYKEFTFSSIPDIDGQPAQKGVSAEGFSTITLVGAPYLFRAELGIDLSKENRLIATLEWILFLTYASVKEKEAADWVHENYPEAFDSGEIEKTFGKAKVILQGKGNLLTLIVVPAGEP